MANDGSVVIDVELNTSKAKNQYNEFGNEIAAKSGRMSSIVKGIAGVAAVGAGAIATAAVAVGKAAVSAYADYEQLVGGVDTLFKGASKTVQNFADEAFKSAGMSANEYMETVTGFSASLIQSLGGDTDKAAKVANQAVIDMSDNANKMGSDIGSIQNAYQGFAKQNYTMLDNLKLGFGGTKEEMQRLLTEAEKISGVKYDISNFADVTEAIHVIQTEMGITGTTAKEAAQTISGSIASTKSAISNLIAGLGNSNAGLEKLVRNVVDSAKNVISNLIPVIGNIAKSLVIVIRIMAEEIGKALLNALPESLRKKLESAISSFKELVAPMENVFKGAKLLAAGLKAIVFNDFSVSVANLKAEFLELFPESLWNNMTKIALGIRSLINGFGEGDRSVKLFKVALDVLKAIFLSFLGPVGLFIKTFELIAKVLGGGDIESGINSILIAVQGLITGFMTYGPQIGIAFGEAIAGIATIIAAALPGIIVGALQIISAFITGIALGLPQLAIAASQLVLSFTAAILFLSPTIIACAVQIITVILLAIAAELPGIIAAGSQVIASFLQGITEQLPMLVENAASLIITWLTELNKYLPEIIQKGMDVLISFLQGIANNIYKITDIAITIILNFVNAIIDRMPEIVQAGVELIVAIIDGISQMIDGIVKAASNLIQEFLRGLAEEVDDIVDAGMDLVDAIVEGLIEAQDRLFKAAIRLINGFANNIRENDDEVRKAGGNLLDALIDAVDPWGLWDKGKELVGNFVDSITSAWNSVSGWIGDFLNPFSASTGPEFSFSGQGAVGQVNALTRAGTTAKGAYSSPLSSVEKLLNAPSSTAIKKLLSGFFNPEKKLKGLLHSTDGVRSINNQSNTKTINNSPQITMHVTWNGKDDIRKTMEEMAWITQVDEGGFE